MEALKAERSCLVHVHACPWSRRVRLRRSHKKNPICCSSEVNRWWNMHLSICCFVPYQIVDDDAEEEKNGVLAAVTNSCSAPDNTNKTDSNKSRQTSTDRQRERSQHSVCSSAMSVMKRLFCIFDCFHVKNPYHIDNYARFSFPLSFIIINVLYWVYYLYF